MLTRIYFAVWIINLQMLGMKGWYKIGINGWAAYNIVNNSHEFSVLRGITS